MTMKILGILALLALSGCAVAAGVAVGAGGLACYETSCITKAEHALGQ
jgi:hypothetical protein